MASTVCSAFGLLGRCMMPSCYWAFVRFDLWSLFSTFFISLESDAAHGMARKRQLVHRRRCCGARVCVFLVGRKHPVLFGCTIRTRTCTGSVCNALGLGPSFLRARTNERTTKAALKEAEKKLTKRAMAARTRTRLAPLHALKRPSYGGGVAVALTKERRRRERKGQLHTYNVLVRRESERASELRCCAAPRNGRSHVVVVVVVVVPRP